jgi:hypothetical protein
MKKIMSPMTDDVPKENTFYGVMFLNVLNVTTEQLSSDV